MSNPFGEPLIVDALALLPLSTETSEKSLETRASTRDVILHRQRVRSALSDRCNLSRVPSMKAASKPTEEDVSSES